MKYGIIILSVLSGVLVACTPTHPSAQVMKGAQVPTIPQGAAVSTVAPVQVPPGLSSTTIQNEYAIPASTPDAQTAQQPVSLVPPGSGIQTSTSTAPAPAPQPQVTAAQAAANQQKQSGSVGLSVKADYTQAWKQVGKASSSAGYPVMEQDSATGTYYVLDKAGSGGVIKRDTPIYQLRVQKQGDNTLVTVYNAQNQPADPATTQRILSAVKNKLE